MLKKCSEEADAKGLTVQKGKGTERTAYRRQCMLKNGVSPKKP
ncbi:putative Phosphate starvation-inducible protein PsiF [Beijerinckiaceae bacterium RH AL1]|nr:putative Phosphate starvation-inducible protein PsiF [Beijerinckiaceae bacterium RH AL8]VVB42500.1 putative Phosphate starvation-inducible protein PsiF [Beijerinckiaceae bacterium RH CH11]VVC53340.1 putative Phosphate starvation-inducible protein PsiF [Beijerinckiaceae bacterium RH AL1]